MDKQKHIWMVNYYSMPPEYVSNERHIKFTYYLQKAGYKVTIFSSGFLPGKNIDLVDNGKLFKKVTYDNTYDFVHIKVRPYQGNGLSRMFSIFQFAWRILRCRKEFEKPDIILQNMHAPFDYSVCTCAKKLGVRYIAEEWDLWPYDFVQSGLISANNPIMKWAYSKERKMYENADALIFSFQGGLDFLRRMHWTDRTGGNIKEKKIHYINNGVSLADFQYNKDKYIQEDKVLDRNDIFKVLYLGSINHANNLITLIKAAELLKDKADIVFIIYGDGSQRVILEEYCNTNKFNNVIFKQKWIPLKYVPSVINRANLSILNYQSGFGEFGISSGKLFQSLAAGKPIVCNIPIMYDNVIKDNFLGVADNLDTPQKYADAILKIYELNKIDYDSMCLRVKDVSKRFDFEYLSRQLINVIENVQ